MKLWITHFHSPWIKCLPLICPNYLFIICRVGEMLGDGSGTTGSSVDCGTNRLTMAVGSEHTNGRDCSSVESTFDLESAYASSTHQLYRAEESKENIFS